MTYDNFTIKAQESIMKAQQIAGENSQQMVDTSHLLKGLLVEEENVSGFLLKKVGINLPALEAELDGIVQSFPKVQGGVDKQFLSSEANRVLSKAKSLAKEFGDEFIPIELILLAIVSGTDRTGRTLREMGASIEALPFAATRGRELDDPLSSVDRVRRHGDEFVLLELSQEATDIAGVEVEATSQVADSGALRADLEQQT